MIAYDLLERVDERHAHGLHAHGREAVGLEYAVPFIGLLRGFPPKLAHGRLCVGYAGVDLHRAVFGINSAKLALRDGNYIRARGVIPLDGGHVLCRRPGEQEHAYKQAYPQEPYQKLDYPPGILQNGIVQGYIARREQQA